jgi:type IV pilus assembly protein PilE
VRGVSLLELLVVLAVLGMLAALAVPSYRGYSLRAGRTEARAALLSLATAQEKFYLQCHTYAATLQGAQPSACSPARLRFNPASERGLYAIAVTAADAAAWSATATRASATSQSADRRCRTFGFNSLGEKSARDDDDLPSTRECWDR